MSIWLYWDPKNMGRGFNHTENGPAEKQMLEMVPSGAAHSLSPPVCDGNTAELRPVGQVEISDEVTLEELKTQVRRFGFVCIQNEGCCVCGHFQMMRCSLCSLRF